MIGKKRREPMDFQAERVAADLEAVLARLSDAYAQVRDVMTEADELLARMGATAPTILSLARSSLQKTVATPCNAVRPAVLPNWDSRRRTLSVGELVVKRFRVPSPNQEAILAAFEEEGWPAVIDDPLRQILAVCPKQRLHDTIKTLNARQENKLLRFRGDGTGERVRFELVEPQETAQEPFQERRLRRAA